VQGSLYDDNIKRNNEPMYDKKLYVIILLDGDNESNNIFKLQKKVL
jgi:hypothetical protein